MDRKSIIVLVVSFLLLMVWFWVVPILYPPIPKPASTNTVVLGTNLTAEATSAPTAQIARPTSAGPTLLEAPWLGSKAPEQIETNETAEATYTFTSRGGGLKTVELKKYLADPSQRSKGKAADRQLVQLNHGSDMPVLGLRGSEACFGDGQFKLTRVSPTVARAEQALSNGLVIIKEFAISSNYLVRAEVRLENRSPGTLALPEHSLAVGMASSLSLQDDPSMLGAMWFNGVKEQQVAPAWFDNKSFCVSGEPRETYPLGDGRSLPATDTNIVWGAVQNQFFTMALLTASNQPAAWIRVKRMRLPPPTPVPGPAPAYYGYEADLVFPAMNLPPGHALERHLLVYAGPKEYKILSRIGYNLDVVMGYTGFFGYVAKALLLSMNALYVVVPNYGIDIILITIIIKLIFWPLTQASTRSMKRMQALQPQMKALQEKYKDDPAKMNKKLMEFMKENKVSPLGGCLPMLVQIPVFIGFYQMIRSAIELRGATFLWARDLSRPDTLFVIPGLDWIPFFGQAGLGLPINPLPLIMGATMLWQARMTPPTPGVDPMQQRIMKYMPMIFMVFLYKFSAGLTLYWTVQNLLTIAQMKLTKTQSAAPGQPGPTPVAPPPKKRNR